MGTQEGSSLSYQEAQEGPSLSYQAVKVTVGELYFQIARCC